MTKFLLKKNFYTVFLTLFFVALLPMQMMAQKKVAYVQFTKTMDATASTTGDDAITRMLIATGFTVTVYGCDVDGKDLATGLPVNLAGNDLIIMQETWGSAANAIKPTGVLGLNKLSALNIPVIYNKSFTFQKVNTRAITSVTGTAFDVVSSSSLSVQPVVGKETNPIFSGITGASIPLFFAGATDTGQLGLATSVKGLSLVNDLEISTPGTLLAGTTGTVAAGTAISTTSNDTSLLINRFPAGTQLGTVATDKLATKDMITFACNYGAIAAGNGTNVTNEFLTLWRNAAYILTGQTPPTTLYANPALGVNDNTLASESITVTPNPTKGIVTVNGISDVKTITVLDINGKTIASKNNTTTIDLSNQTPGLYFVKIQTEKGSATKKIVVE